MSDIPQWALERALQLCTEQMVNGDPAKPWSTTAFARYIAAHEEPPVDPLLIEAREIAANEVVHGLDFHWQHTEAVNIALAALKRGIELAKAGEA